MMMLISAVALACYVKERR